MHHTHPRHLIYKSKHGVCLFVYLFDKQGRARAVTLAFPGRYLLAAQGRAGAGWPGQIPAHWTCWLYIGSLGKTGGPASNQTKIQFFKKIIFIIEHIKKTKIFLKKKIETK
jgi:hypothetical protein